tara:strand:+ start:3861 stop:4604 length:744 start_codon:yes stop_codon:yes gene_type:complete
MNKILSLVLLMSTTFVFAQATDDNEVKITQVGDTLKLYIDQVGFGNKIGGSDGSDGSLSSMTLTGSTLDFNIDMIGNQNLLYGPFIADSYDLILNVTGDSNEFDWNVGSSGSSDSGDMNFVITGDSNTFDIDQGATASAEFLNADLVLQSGSSSNVFDIDWESDNIVWNLDIDGSSNNINTLQNDGEQSLTLTLDGSSADVDINQLSGTCAAGASNACSSPNAIINLDVDSENAIIQINQKDSSNDS